MEVTRKKMIRIKKQIVQVCKLQGYYTKIIEFLAINQ